MTTYKIQSKDSINLTEQDIQKALNKAFGKNSFMVEKVNNDNKDLISAMPIEEKNKDKTQPEINGIIESIHRYIAVNKGVCFIGSFMAFECKCKDCSKSGEDEIDIKEDASRIFAFGDLESLRGELNFLRDLVEDEVDEEGFVSI